MRFINRSVLAAAGTLAAAAAVAVSTGAAGNAPQQFVTHASNHADTTSLPAGVTGATIASPQGPVWAYDNLTVTLTPQQVTGQSDGANWQVTADVTGSFHGFADPNTGAALNSNGSVKGTITYDVQATQAPDKAGLPSQEPGGIGGPGLTDMISQLFDGHATIVGGGNAYTFSYQNGAYVQVGAPNPGISGDVSGN